MSILFPALDEIFTIRTFKHADVAIENSWANTYEFVANDSATMVDLQAAAGACLAFETEMALDTTIIDKAVVSTWIPDGVPYDPSSFFVIDYNIPGEATSPAAADMLSLEHCLHLRRVVPTGRFGKLFLRGTLVEADIQGRAGSMTLTAPATMATRVNAALTASSLDDYFNGFAAHNVALVMASVIGGVSAVRSVTDLTPVNAKLVKLHHKWFNRS